jgi:hypothetical protein
MNKELRIKVGKLNNSTKCVFEFCPQILPRIFLILKSIPRDRYFITVHRPSHQVPVILIRFQKAWIFSTYFLKISDIEFYEKFVHCEPSCYLRTNKLTDGRADMTLIVTFRSFANARKEAPVFTHNVTIPFELQLKYV